MNWFIEHLQRDGTVLTRLPVPMHGVRIGRALDNDLVLDDPHCAAYHAQLSIDANGAATLTDLGSKNGIAHMRGKRVNSIAVANDKPLRVGQSIVRVRSADWPLAPEQSLSSQPMWLWGMLALAVTLGHAAYEVWLKDLSEQPPPYLYGLSAMAAGIAIWSGLYALLGRLISGSERFFTHVLIACCGYLVAVLADNALEVLAFASGWLWPLQISRYVLVLIAALTVRAHLRVADPRHWPALRWGVAVVTLAIMFVPTAQLWISSQRLTNIQTLNTGEHPVLRLAAPVRLQDFSQSVEPLKIYVDKVRTREDLSDMPDGLDD
jgi:hypothetical protein